MPNENAAANLRHDSEHQAEAARARAVKSPFHQVRQVIAMQQTAFQAANDPDTPVKFRASLMRAHHDYTRLLMDIMGQGKPRPVTARNDPDAKPRKPKAWSVEPIEPK